MSITEVEGKQGHAPVKYICTQKYSSLHQSNFIEITRLS